MKAYLKKTTKEHYGIFKEECNKWIDYWGLHGWEVTFRHEHMEDARATACFNSLEDRQVTLALAIEWTERDGLCEKAIREVAFHETEELRYARIEFLAKQRFVQPSEIREEIHNLIQQDRKRIFLGE